MKGSVLDVFVIAVVALVLSITILVSYTILDRVDDAMPTAGKNATAKGLEAVQTFDYGFIIMVGGLGLAGVIYAYLVPTNPILIVVSVVMLLAATVVTPIISNAFGTVSTNDQMSAASAQFPVMGSFMENLPVVMTVIGVIILIAMYIRRGDGSGSA